MDRYKMILQTLKRTMSDEVKAYEIFCLFLGPQQEDIFRSIPFGKHEALTATEIQDECEMEVTTSNIHTQIRQLRERCTIIKVDDTNSRRYKYYIEL